MDPENPDVKLCSPGMEAESEGAPDLARDCFRRAWETASDEYEKCIAAHYLARHQPPEDERLLWNRRALDLAEAAGGPRVKDLYPSLLLNLGHSFQATGDRVQAGTLYARAEESSAGLPEGPYTDPVRGGIASALTRIASADGASE